MADYLYINDSGVIVPDTSLILLEVQEEYKNVFGTDLVVTADTPQGVLIVAEALARTAVVNNNAAMANQINPNEASGVLLDAIGGMTGIERTPATRSFLSGVELTGEPGTVISAGTQAKTAAGDIFESVTIVTLDGSGNATTDFQSVEYGPIPCAIEALDELVTNVLGWETVSNPVAAVLGTTTQSDQAFRAYRNNTLAFQGVSLAEAITSTLYATEGVTSLSFRENYDDVPAGMLISVTDGATLADTIWGLVTGGIITVGTNDMVFIESLQALPTPVNPWPIAKYTTTGNVTLSGLGTQAGGDWSGSMTAGDIVLVKDNTTETQNGVWVAAAGAWTRQEYNTNGEQILGAIDGLSLKKNSVYACVKGGTDLDIAAALLENKSSGSGWNGGVEVEVVEPASEQTYAVLFDRPEEVGILVKVYTTNGSTPDIIQAVLDYADGLIEGMEGWGVGVDISPFEIAAAINIKFPQYYIKKVEISLISPTVYSTDEIIIALNQKAYTQDNFVTVVIS